MVPKLVESWVVLVLHSFTSFNVVHFRSGIQLSAPELAYHVTLPLQCERGAQLKAKGNWILIQWGARALHDYKLESILILLSSTDLAVLIFSEYFLCSLQHSNGKVQT